MLVIVEDLGGVVVEPDVSRCFLYSAPLRQRLSSGHLLSLTTATRQSPRGYSNLCEWCCSTLVGQQGALWWVLISYLISPGWVNHTFMTLHISWWVHVHDSPQFTSVLVSTTSWKRYLGMKLLLIHSVPRLAADCLLFGDQQYLYRFWSLVF